MVSKTIETDYLLILEVIKYILDYQITTYIQTLTSSNSSY